MSTDIHFMKIAIEMARSGVGKTFPKPSVGAVIVKDGNIISKAVTANAGVMHAEPGAIEQAGKNAKGATLYVTLEPCNHHGNTPPCSDAVIAAGIKKVVIANRDENPKAAGGIEKLRSHGIEVVENICAKEAMEINRPFFNTITKKRPYIIAKVGSSIDGKIALADGKSKYITSETARDYVHVLRSRADGILVGVNTIISDDPELTCRVEGISKVLPKIILDTHYRMPENCKIIKNAGKEPVLIFSSRDGKSTKAQVIKTPTNKHNNFVDINFVLRYLAEKGYERLLVEGGGKVISSFIKENLIDEFHIMYSSKILGNSSISFASEINMTEIKESNYRLSDQRKFGDDVLLIFKNKDLD